MIEVRGNILGFGIVVKFGFLGFWGVVGVFWVGEILDLVIVLYLYLEKILSEEDFVIVLRTLEFWVIYGSRGWFIDIDL